MATPPSNKTLPRLRLAARYRMLSSEVNKRVYSTARWLRKRLSNRGRFTDDAYDEPWLRDWIERS